MKTRGKYLFIAIFMVGAAAIIVSMMTPFTIQAQNTNTENHSVTYQYDDAGRLILATYDEQIQIRYVYDDAGNLVDREISDNLTGIESWGIYE